MKMQLNRNSKKRIVPMLALILAASTGTANADDSSPRYTVSAIADAAQGQKVLANKFDVAIPKLEKAQSDGIRGFYVATNLCVAHLKTGEYDNAEKTCDRAVAAISSELENERSAGKSRAMERAYRRFLSVALSNRGVAYAVNGESDLARDDFNAALEIRSTAREPQTNLARLAEVAAPSA